jgi:hypothetical protein
MRQGSLDAGFAASARCRRRSVIRGVLRIDSMAAANSTRSWLPEMLDELQQSWSRCLRWEEYSSICDRMTEIRTQLRQERGVKGPKMFCRRCKEIREMTPGPVTIRSVLFALRKRGLLTDEELESMDVEWRRYRAKHRLDGRGRKRAEQTAAGNSRPAEQSDGMKHEHHHSI